MPTVVPTVGRRSPTKKTCLRPLRPTIGNTAGRTPPFQSDTLFTCSGGLHTLSHPLAPQKHTMRPSSPTPPCRVQKEPRGAPGPYRGTSLIRIRTPLGPYRRPMPRVLGGSQGGGRFLMGEVPLHESLSGRARERGATHGGEGPRASDVRNLQWS